MDHGFGLGEGGAVEEVFEAAEGGGDVVEGAGGEESAGLEGGLRVGGRKGSGEGGGGG